MRSEIVKRLYFLMNNGPVVAGLGSAHERPNKLANARSASLTTPQCLLEPGANLNAHVAVARFLAL